MSKSMKKRMTAAKKARKEAEASGLSMEQQVQRWKARTALKQYAVLIEKDYAKARLIDVLKLSSGNQYHFRMWMDHTRRMQAVLDADAGKGSPQALQALRALMAGWLRFVRSCQSA
jgi:hypothetical protein